MINLGPEEILKAKGQDIVVPGYSVPSFEDWNNDGRKDLIIGEGGGGATREDPRLPQRGDRCGPLFRGLLLRPITMALGHHRHAGRVPGLFPPLGVLGRG